MLGIPNLEQTLSNFLEDSSGITAIRSIEWDKKYLWVIQFDDPAPPSPFDKFFPASDIMLPASIVESGTLELPFDTITYPLRTQQKDLVVTFYDDQQRTLLKWLSDWQRLDLLNLGKFTSGLGDSHQAVAADSFGILRNVVPVRKVRIGLLDAYKDEVLVKDLWVYPDGPIGMSLNQASEAQTYQVTFKVLKDGVGDKAGGSSIFSAKGIKQILGRFI